MHGYQASLRPWLWFLTRTTDCRIFQDQSVPDIVAAVFGDHGGIARFKFNLYRGYCTRTYCVQYRETDFNFVARHPASSTSTPGASAARSRQAAWR